MSYVEICDKFEEVLNYLGTTSDETSSLAKFFMSYKRLLESFSIQLQKLSETFKVSELPEGNINTLSLCLFSMKEHLQTLSDQQLLLIKSIQLDIIEPLELFTEHFTTTNSDLKIKGLYNYRELKTSQTRMNKHKQDYYKTSAELEKATRLSMTEESKDKQENAQRLSIHFMTLQEKHLDNYIQGIVDVNKH